jgi:hypothetical protein
MIDNVGDALQVKLLIHADSNMDVVCHDAESLFEDWRSRRQRLRGWKQQQRDDNGEN